jgi:cobalamin biosynthesis protein CobD/CbiB
VHRILTTVAGAVLGVLVVLASVSTPLRAAGGHAAIARLARILINFTHVPSLSQAETLQSILNDPSTTAPERVLADAVMNMEHIVSRDDRAALEALIRDAAVPAAVKTLATILTRVTHTPAEADKETLRQLCTR